MAVRTAVNGQLEYCADLELEGRLLQEEVDRSAPAGASEYAPAQLSERYALEGVTPEPANECRHSETVE